MNRREDLGRNGAARLGRPVWQKPSYSVEGECVEAAALDGYVGVRNHNDPTSGTIYFTKAEFDAFLKGVKAGEFDLLA